MNESEPILCYVEWVEKTAYFTTQKLEEARGDDWDDGYYAINAEKPYDPGSSVRDEAKWVIVGVEWDGPFITPTSENNPNDPDYCELSVFEINDGVQPWLRSIGDTTSPIKIMAGTPISEFVRLIESGGGKTRILD